MPKKGKEKRKNKSQKIQVREKPLWTTKLAETKWTQSFLIRIEIDIIHGVTCSNEHWNGKTNPRFIRAVSDTQNMSFSYVQKSASQIHKPPTNFNQTGWASYCQHPEDDHLSSHPMLLLFAEQHHRLHWVLILDCPFTMQSWLLPWAQHFSLTIYS